MEEKEPRVYHSGDPVGTAEEHKQLIKQKRGFAAMSPERQRAIASKGGKASHQPVEGRPKGRGHSWDSKAARIAGKKGGAASRGGRGKLPSTQEQVKLETRGAIKKAEFAVGEVKQSQAYDDAHTRERAASTAYDPCADCGGARINHGGSVGCAHFVEPVASVPAESAPVSATPPDAAPTRTGTGW